ncbi:hypothetical protein Droror1_Dr00017615 [Drosera rotundifolia]
MTVPLDTSFRGNAVDLSDSDSRVKRTVTGWMPKQVMVSLLDEHSSIWRHFIENIRNVLDETFRRRTASIPFLATDVKVVPLIIVVMERRGVGRGWLMASDGLWEMNGLLSSKTMNVEWWWFLASGWAYGC